MSLLANNPVQLVSQYSIKAVPVTVFFWKIGIYMYMYTFSVKFKSITVYKLVFENAIWHINTTEVLEMTVVHFTILRHPGV